MLLVRRLSLGWEEFNIKMKNKEEYKVGMNPNSKCDGDYWHKYPIGRDIDHIRTSELIEKGFKVLRIWEKEIKKLDLGNFQNKLNLKENK